MKQLTFDGDAELLAVGVLIDEYRRCSFLGVEQPAEGQDGTPISEATWSQPLFAAVSAWQDGYSWPVLE